VSDRIRTILETARVIAVLGAHEQTSRPAGYVPQYLYQQGYRIIPVNPAFAGKTLFGERVRARLDEIEEPIDMVDVFRRPEALPQHTEEILSMKPLPKIVWLQLGIRNDPFAKDLEAKGIEVVQDRCTLADHKRLGLKPISSSP